MLEEKAGIIYTSVLIVGKVFKKKVVENETEQIGMACPIFSAKEHGFCLIV